MSATTIPAGAEPMSIEEEHAFWLDILRDHLGFILDALPHQLLDVDFRDEVLSLQDRLDDLVSRIDDSPTFATEAISFAEEVGYLKRLFLKEQLQGLGASLEPTAINHMLNELEEYIAILQEYILEGSVSPKDPLHHHKLWLLDAKGHLDFIKARLDPVEKELKKLVKEEGKRLHHLYMKALEFIGYLRADTGTLPQFDRLDRAARAETLLYLDLIKDLSQTLPETVSIVPEKFLDHAFKEQQYYLRKLAISLRVD